VRGIVIYDSIFGNTEQVAVAVRSSLSLDGGAEVVRVADMTPGLLADADFIVIGSPTRGFRPTDAIVHFLKALPAGALNGKRAAAFDTRISVDDIEQAMLRIIVKNGGYAAPNIAKRLEKCGARIEAPPEGFFVKGSEGPLKEGEVERAASWAKRIAAAAQSGNE